MTNAPSSTQGPLDAPAPTPSTAPAAWEPMPAIDLRQLLRLSDDTGVFQHATYSMPDPRHGYCIDDNARALIAALHLAQLRGEDQTTLPLDRYLTFLAYAFNEDKRRFRNFMGYDRRWLEDEGSQDSQGRTLWALGMAVNIAPSQNVGELAENLFRKAMPALEEFQYLRSQAFALIGLDAFLKHYRDDAYAIKLRDTFAQKLFDAYKAHATDDWPFWEDSVTYDNAKLCHALLLSGQAMGRQDMIAAALQSLAWLLKVQTADDGHLSIIGNHGWMTRAGHHARFDQQPLEAYAMVHGCLAAADATGDSAWADHAWRCFEWFRGKNDLGVWLYHPETGGCHDGLNADGPNKNQGAESSLAYLLSVLELHRYREDNLGRITAAEPRTIGLAVIGASRFAEFCLEQYRQVEHVHPVAVWNRTHSKAQRLAETHQLKAYENLDDLLNDPQVQLVHVATTPARHHEHALAALTHGKHVLCEKPLAIRADDAHALIHAAGEQDLVLTVNFMMRFGPLAEAVKQIVDQNLLGRLLRGMFVNRAGDEGLGEDHWFWDTAESGGIFIEHGVHTFDLLRSWLGRGTVLAAYRMRRPGKDFIDQVGCEVRYGDQTVVSFYHAFNQPVALDQQDTRLIFERGQIMLTGWIAGEIHLRALVTDAQLQHLEKALPGAQIRTLQQFPAGQGITHRGTSEPLDREVEITWRDNRNKQTIYGCALQTLLTDTLAAIHNRHHRPRVTAHDGLAALETALEATRIAAQITP